MERTANSWTLATLTALVFLLSCPVRSWCKEDTYKLLTENKPECLPNDFADLKRFSNIDYDSFVGLMGRRSADRRGTPISRKRDLDDFFTSLLGRKTSEPRGDYSQARGGLFVNHGRLRFQRFV
ncbi:tachykinin-3b [Centroberyx affinis]|uniref:tachykinin-3b n=1 Tax=Centroberyx affinis TaxID=166261 RepID=UPI003A5C231D